MLLEGFASRQYSLYNVLVNRTEHRQSGEDLVLYTQFNHHHWYDHFHNQHLDVSTVCLCNGVSPPPPQDGCYINPVNPD